MIRKSVSLALMLLLTACSHMQGPPPSGMDRMPCRCECPHCKQQMECPRCKDKMDCPRHMEMMKGQSAPMKK